MEHRWWKFRNVFITIWLAFCFILTALSLIIYFSADEVHKPYDPEHLRHVNRNERVKFHTLLDYKPVDFNATWVSDDEILTQDESGNIVLYNVNKSIKSVLAFNTMKHMKYCKKYKLSADKKYLFIAYNEDTNDYLSTANYDVINIKTGTQVTLLDSNHRPRDIMVARWSPIDSSLVFVDDYNVYYVPTVSKPNRVKQITFHGSKDLYNGVADWVYEEEIFDSKCAMWFSNGGTKLAYATFDETLVPTAHISQYGIPETMYDQYSRIFSYHYPKVNDPNPTVKLFVKNLDVNDDSEPISIKPIKKYENETILYKVAWSDDNHLYVMWMNRLQNKSHLTHYHIENNITTNVEEVIEFTQENGWLEFSKSLLVHPKHYVALIFRTQQDDNNTYGHVCVIKPDGELKPITSGRFEVTRLIKWDFETNYLYYTANLQDGSETKYVFRVLVDLQQVFKPECLTCDTQCAINDAVFSAKNTYFSHICQGPRVPYVNIMKTSRHSVTISEWEKNKKLRKDMENVILPGVIVTTVPLEDGFEARVRLTIPRKIDTRSSTKYPLLIYSYGGPLIDIAMDYYKIDVNMYLSANHDIVVAEIDGRGTGGRGSETLFANYLKLGTGDVQDQITVAKYLQSSLSYIDSDRTCIWGWSFGGYVAGMALAKDDEKIFKCGLSVAPITDWIYYDSMYAERFMGSYKENFENYRNSSLVENAESLRDKRYMIIHGMFDKNVHFQHSAMLAKELQHRGIRFVQQGRLKMDVMNLLQMVNKIETDRT